MRYNMIELREKQRHGEKLEKDEIKYIIDGYTYDEIPGYQMSAYLMAVCFTGLDDELTAYMTECMAKSGDMLDLSQVDGVVADKHSTGGVGDKTTLAVVPIVAACGGKVAKMSGRGLGFTGGTIDKLEAIKGFNTNISFDRFIENINTVGAAIIGQMQNLTPADKKIYALRDVTGTVDCLPLIASSVMSKKLASGAESIVLDVKHGSGAFMKNSKDARRLAELMTKIGESAGRRVKAVITSMDEPLGEAVGNSLEVVEAVNTLKNKGPKDFYKLCIELSASMLELSLGLSYDECAALAEQSVKSGAALEKLAAIVSSQDGDAEYILNTENFEKAACIVTVKANRSGTIKSMNTEKIGMVSCMLGAGRETLDSRINPSAGLIIKKKTDDKVACGDVLAYLHTDDAGCIPKAETEYLNSINII